MGTLNEKTNKNEVFYQVEVMNDFGDFHRPDVLFETREEIEEILEDHGFVKGGMNLFRSRVWRRERTNNPDDAVLANIVVLFLNDKYEEEKINQCLRTTPLYTED